MDTGQLIAVIIMSACSIFLSGFTVGVICARRQLSN
jgi:hypothetical protein